MCELRSQPSRFLTLSIHCNICINAYPQTYAYPLTYRPSSARPCASSAPHLFEPSPFLVLPPHRYESCWPAIQHEASGVLFVYSAARADRDAKELESLYTSFVQQQGLRDSQCVVLAHQQGADPAHAAKLRE